MDGLDFGERERERRRKWGILKRAREYRAGVMVNAYNFKF